MRLLLYCCFVAQLVEIFTSFDLVKLLVVSRIMLWQWCLSRFCKRISQLPKVGLKTCCIVIALLYFVVGTRSVFKLCIMLKLVFAFHTRYTL